jgi:hypothetical protein
MKRAFLGLGRSTVDIDRLAALSVTLGDNAMTLREAVGEKVLNLIRAHPEAAAHWDTVRRLENWRVDDDFNGKPWLGSAGTSFGTLEMRVWKDSISLDMFHYRETDQASVLGRLNIAALNVRAAGHPDFRVDAFQVLAPPNQSVTFGSTGVIRIPLDDAGFEFVRQVLNTQHTRIDDRGPMAAVEGYRAALTQGSHKSLSLPL